MIKAKWLYSEIPTSLRQLSELMLASQYSEKSGSGFLLSTATEDTLSGRYIEKVINRSIIEDPFGEISEVHTVSYYTCRFNWRSDSKLLCITEPPRSLRKFINCLHDILGLGLVVAEMTVCPDKWLSEIEKRGTNLTVTKLSSFGINTPHESLAKIAVTAKKDVRNDFYELIGQRQHKVDCVCFSIDYSNDIHAACELLKTGACKVKSSSPSFVLDELRHTLEASHAF